MSFEQAMTNERDALAAFLDQQREGLVRKVRGVSDADARKAPTASSLTLLGLLKHSTIWEARWFHAVIGGRELDDGWPTQRQAKDADFVVDDSDTVDDWITRYEQACATSREIVAAKDLDDPSTLPDVVACNVRYVLLHLIEETARHAGHADIIRETIDGSRGMF